MTTPETMVWELIAKRDQLLGEIGALQNKIAGLEMAIAMLRGEANHREEDDAPRQSVKGTLLALLDEAGAYGLNASLAIKQAARRGIKLDRGSVSSMLSRFKREGTAVHDGERYKLKRYVGMTFSYTDERVSARA